MTTQWPTPRPGEQSDEDIAKAKDERIAELEKQLAEADSTRPAEQDNDIDRPADYRLTDDDDDDAPTLEERVAAIERRLDGGAAE